MIPVMQILFPSDYFKPTQPDEMYQEQAQAFASLEMGCSVVSVDSLTAVSPIHPANPNSTYLYRGWMLTEQAYQTLCEAIRHNGGQPYTTPAQYVAAHYLPNWYPAIQDLTPETAVLPIGCDLKQELQNLGWEQYFIKDYVKSLKTARGAIINKPAEIDALVEEMQVYRGQIEGGLCIRRVESFLPETEKRYFVINGRSFAASEQEPIPDIVQECAQRFTGSPFFSVDCIQRADGVARIVEIGDGQVSDIVGWTAVRLAHLLKTYG